MANKKVVSPTRHNILNLDTARMNGVKKHPLIRRQERRKGPDFLSKAIGGLGLFCSTLLVLSMLLVDRAKPRIETFFDRILGVHLHDSWDNDILLINFYVVTAIFTLSIIGLLFNSQRARRRSDNYSRVLIFLAIISLSALIFFETYKFSGVSG